MAWWLGMAENPELMLQVIDVSKHYGGVHALREVRLDVRPGEINALVGENGAGKSTRTKVLAGGYTDYTGSIDIAGQPARLEVRPRQAERAGIAIIHQELATIPASSVMENVYMGHMESRAGWIDWRTHGKRPRATYRPGGAGRLPPAPPSATSPFPSGNWWRSPRRWRPTRG